MPYSSADHVTLAAVFILVIGTLAIGVMIMARGGTTEELRLYRGFGGVVSLVVAASAGLNLAIATMGIFGLLVWLDLTCRHRE